MYKIYLTTDEEERCLVIAGNAEGLTKLKVLIDQQLQAENNLNLRQPIVVKDFEGDDTRLRFDLLSNN